MRKLLNEELNRKSVDEFKQSTKAPIIVILDNVRSLNNVGSVFRTADAFLLEALYLCGITGTPPNNEIRKTALGATETVVWKHFASTLEAVNELKKEGWIICSVEQAESSVMLNSYVVPANAKIALVFGNEVKGVEQEVVNASDTIIEIPQLGTKHSLNISVSVGIVIWDIIQKINS